MSPYDVLLRKHYEDGEYIWYADFPFLCGKTLIKRLKAYYTEEKLVESISSKRNSYAY